MANTTRKEKRNFSLTQTEFDLIMCALLAASPKEIKEIYDEAPDNAETMAPLAAEEVVSMIEALSERMFNEEDTIFGDDSNL